jgi:hypothetical protein
MKRKEALLTPDDVHNILFEDVEKKSMIVSGQFVAFIQENPRIVLFT